MEKKKFRISGKLIFNLAVVAISIYLIIYFFVSEDGLIDLLKKPDGCNMLIILAALYQIVMTAVSVIAVITRFNYFSDAFTNIWSTLFIIFGFTVQLAMTALFLLVSFSHKVTNKLIDLIYKIMKKFKFIKNPEKKVERLHKEVDMFHDTNKRKTACCDLCACIYTGAFNSFNPLSHLYCVRYGTDCKSGRSADTFIL